MEVDQKHYSQEEVNQNHRSLVKYYMVQFLYKYIYSTDEQYIQTQLYHTNYNIHFVYMSYICIMLLFIFTLMQYWVTLKLCQWGIMVTFDVPQTLQAHNNSSNWTSFNTILDIECLLPFVKFSPPFFKQILTI